MMTRDEAERRFKVAEAEYNAAVSEYNRAVKALRKADKQLDVKQALVNQARHAVAAARLRARET